MTQQAFFDFLARPFQAPPQDGLFVPLEPMADAISQLCEAAVKGDGIGVLTATPGAGKTVVCQQVQARLAGDFATVLLPSCRFPTRRAMLQSILHSLGCEYMGLSEQESLLKLLDAVESVQPERQGLVLIADEAHQLGTRLLEELRCLTNHVEKGQPLIRVLLSGQLALEELLTKPELHSLNYRITCHTTLEPLSMQQSARYIDERLARVGGDACSLFGDDALEMICRISDGNPRCLNQLADACLTHAAETGQRTVDARMVRHVLRDLKQLPLQWNESACDQIDDADQSSLASPLSMEEDDISVFDADQTPPATADGHQLGEPFGEDRAATGAPSQEPAWLNDVVTIEVGGDDDRSLGLGSVDDVSAAGGDPAADFRTDPVCCDDGLRMETSDGQSPIERFPAEFTADESSSTIEFGAAPVEAMFELAEFEAMETKSPETGVTVEEPSLLPSLEITMPLASADPSVADGNVSGCGQAGLCSGSGQLEELDIFDRYAALDRNAEAAQRFDDEHGMAQGLDWTDGIDCSNRVAGPEQQTAVRASSATRHPEAEEGDATKSDAVENDAAQDDMPAGRNDRDQDVPADAGSPVASPLENIDRVIRAVSDAVATEIARDRGLSPAELDDEEPHCGTPQPGTQQPESQQTGPQQAEAQQADLRASHWRATPDPLAFDVIEPDDSDRSEDAGREFPTPQNPTLSQPAILAENPVDGAAELEPMVGLGELPRESDDATESLQQALDALLDEQRQESETNRLERRVDPAGEAAAPRGSRERPYARLFSRARRGKTRT